MSDISVNGKITAQDGVVQIQVTDMSSVGIAISGTWTGTLIPEVSGDGVSWSASSMLVLGSGTVIYNTTTNNIWQSNCAGYLFFRIRALDISSGAAEIVLHATPNASVVSVSNIAVPNGTRHVSDSVVPIGAYNAGSDDTRNLNVDDDGGLLVSNVGTTIVSGLVDVTYQSAGGGGSTAFRTLATLPAAGAYQTLSSPGTNGWIQLTATTVKTTVYITYTRGAAGGQAAHKFYASNGTDVGQLMSIDGTYNGINGAPTTSASPIVYVMTFDTVGLAYFGIVSAEIGVTGTPGTCSAVVSFG